LPTWSDHPSRRKKRRRVKVKSRSQVAT